MSTSFEVLAANTDQGEIWDAMVARVDRCDVYFHRTLCQAFAEYEGCVARMGLGQFSTGTDLGGGLSGICGMVARKTFAYPSLSLCLGG